MHGKTGKLPPKHEPHALRLAKYLTGASAPAPTPLRDLLTRVDRYTILGNDRAGNCTFGSLYHYRQAWGAASGNFFTPTREMALGGYITLTGYDPNTGANDNGAQMADVIAFAQAGNLPGIKPIGKALVDWTNPAEVTQACDWFGGVYVGIQLPRSAEEQFDARQPIVRGWWPQVVGGHAILIGGPRSLDYGPDCVLWGVPDGPVDYPSPVLPMSWDFLRYFGDEAHVLLDPSWFVVKDGQVVDASAMAPDGLNYAQLIADLQTLPS